LVIFGLGLTLNLHENFNFDFKKRCGIVPGIGPLEFLRPPLRSVRALRSNSIRADSSLRLKNGSARDDATPDEGYPGWTGASTFGARRLRFPRPADDTGTII